jgi:hypothetical protein
MILQHFRNATFLPLIVAATMLGLLGPLFLAVIVPWHYRPTERVRFSLRSLLITTTLVALILGLLAYAARH